MIRLDVKTARKVELVDVTSRVGQAVREAGFHDGACLVYVPHTTAGVVINESADPSVPADIAMALDRMAPEGLPYRHAEGNSPAHVKSCLVGASVLVPVERGELVLGRWQGVFFCEFDGPRRREIWIGLMGAGPRGRAEKGETA